MQSRKAVFFAFQCAGKMISIHRADMEMPQEVADVFVMVRFPNIKIEISANILSLR